MNPIPRWAVATSTAAPVLLISGWTIAAVRQPEGYDSVRDTISALAARGATDRWIMTSALAGLGACHILTALGLQPARTAGRAVFAGGGAATILVAVFPQPVRGNSMAHTVVATAAFIALGVWPAFSSWKKTQAPLLHRPMTAAATLGLLGLVAWFAAEIHGGQRGLAERAAAGAQAIWPLAVVISTRRALARDHAQ